MSALLSSLKLGNNNGYNHAKFSASTERKLESLGIDPTLMTSESQAISLISTRQAERGFQSFVEKKELESKRKNFTTDTGLFYTMSIQANNSRCKFGL